MALLGTFGYWWVLLGTFGTFGYFWLILGSFELELAGNGLTWREMAGFVLSILGFALQSLELMYAHI